MDATQVCDQSHIRMRDGQGRKMKLDKVASGGCMRSARKGGGMYR